MSNILETRANQCSDIGKQTHVHGGVHGGREGERGRDGERERENVIKSVYGVLSLTHKSWTTCSLEVITPGSRDILHVNSESLHLKLGVKIPFPPIDKLNHLQGGQDMISLMYLPSIDILSYRFNGAARQHVLTG